MLKADLNIFDAVVLGVLILSALLSFFRGFLREVFSLGTWIGASVVSLYAYPHVAEMLASKIANDKVAGGIASIGTFLAALLVLSIIGAILLKYLKPSKEVGMVDNTLGLIFGVARGTLLLAIGYYIMSLFLLPEDYPDWVKEAATKPYVEEAATALGNIAPEYIATLAPKQGDPVLGKLLKKNEPGVDEGGNTITLHDDNADSAVSTDTGSDAEQWPQMQDLRDSIANESQNEASHAQ